MSGDEHYVYHAPVEPSPRATASGDQNIVGVGLGALMPVRPVGYPIRYVDGNYLPEQQQPGPQRLPPGSIPSGGGVTPTYVLRTPSIYPYPGATATVPQPPPSAGGPSNLIPLPQALPISPAPSPTVAVSADQTAPQLTQPGTTLDSSGASITTASGIGTWLAQSNLISGVPNWGIAAGALVLAMMMFGGKAGRR